MVKAHFLQCGSTYFFNYRPKNILEIGVYRGQTLSLFHILSNLYDISSNIYGITPLSSSGDEVSSYIDIDYLEDINKNFKFFNLQSPISLMNIQILIEQ